MSDVDEILLPSVFIIIWRCENMQNKTIQYFLRYIV